MTRAILDDHVVRDLLADDLSEQLERLLDEHEPATTNLFLYRLCKSVVSARGGALTGAWDAEQRRALGTAAPYTRRDDRDHPDPTHLAHRMAEIAAEHRVSTIGAEAVAAAEQLNGPLCVWDGGDGPGSGRQWSRSPATTAPSAADNHPEPKSPQAELEAGDLATSQSVFQQPPEWSDAWPASGGGGRPPPRT